MRYVLAILASIALLGAADVGKSSLMCVIKDKSTYLQGDIGEESLKCLQLSERIGVEAIILDSPGGSVYYGEQMLKLLNESKTISHVYCERCYSSAGFIFILNNKRRVMLSKGKVMLHKIYNKYPAEDAPLIWTEEDLLKQHDELVKDNLAMSKRITAVINMSLGAYQKKIKDDWYIEAEEALKLKMADEVVDVKDKNSK